MFAALNTMEPPILDLANARLSESDKPWFKERLTRSMLETDAGLVTVAVVRDPRHAI